MATHEPSAETQLTLGPEDDGRFVSAEEFASASFVEPWTYERVDGRLVVMSPEGEEHVDYSEPWRDALVLYKRLSRPDVVQKVVSNAWIRVNDGTDRIGDIGVYLVPDGPVPPIPDRVPDLMFEIVSPGRTSLDRDYVEKREEYHRLGVREYVIIDRFKKIVTVLTHGPGGYEEQILTLADAYRSPLLPGLEFPLAEAFEP